MIDRFGSDRHIMTYLATFVAGSLLLFIGAQTASYMASAQIGSSGEITSTNSTGTNSTTTSSMSNNTLMSNAMNMSSTATTTSTVNYNGSMISHGYLRGLISNVQLNNNSQPAWIQSGYWALKPATNSSGNATWFMAQFEMIKPDGTAMHTHTITNFTMTNSSMQGNSTYVINGTATVSLMGNNIPDVPLTIKIMHQNLIALWIGPQGVNGHFGTGPLYGTVLHGNGLFMRGFMMKHGGMWNGATGSANSAWQSGLNSANQGY